MSRAAFGGPLADVGWTELPFVAPLPENVARDAATVRAAIGVSRALRPRQAIAKLVDYFRGFADSDEPPPSRGSVYLDLALSKRGVCRHRAYAFLVTAQSLGLPTRLVENEEHAWVEVHDGLLWRRIDLGGAGLLSPQASAALAKRTPYTPAADAFPWPRGSERGDDAVPRSASAGSPGSTGRTAGGTAGGASPNGASSGAVSNGAASGAGTKAAAAPMDDRSAADPDDRRPAAAITLVVSDPVVHRGVPLHVRGDVRAGGDPCAHVAVELSLAIAATGKRVALGAVATRDDGTFEGTVVPTGVPLGDYEVFAETPGDARCGRGRN